MSPEPWVHKSSCETRARSAPRMWYQIMVFPIQDGYRNGKRGSIWNRSCWKNFIIVCTLMHGFWPQCVAWVVSRQLMGHIPSCEYITSRYHYDKYSRKSRNVSACASRWQAPGVWGWAAGQGQGWLLGCHPKECSFPLASLPWNWEGLPGERLIEVSYGRFEVPPTSFSSFHFNCHWKITNILWSIHLWKSYCTCGCIIEREISFEISLGILLISMMIMMKPTLPEGSCQGNLRSRCIYIDHCIPSACMHISRSCR